MPTKQKHRGQNSADKILFKNENIPTLCKAVNDLSWLLTNGYSEKSSLKLVGDRYRFKERQRKAVRGAACSAVFVKKRKESIVNVEDLKNKNLHIDGFNLLITIESALSKGFLIKGKDGNLRDLAGIHGSYKRVIETQIAMEIIGKAIEQLKISTTFWYFDKPVSNSGRLKTILRELAEMKNWNWDIELVYNPDNELLKKEGVVVSSDGIVLNGAKMWFNLTEFIVENYIPDALIIDLQNQI